MSEIILELPPELLKTIERQASANEKSVSEYVVSLLNERIPTLPEENQADSFNREVAAFAHLKPMLLNQYGGEFVAIYQGQVIGHGEDEVALFRQVLAQYGPVSCYIEKVVPETPRRARMPSIRVKAV
ncbi:MAG TPA: DUF5678 domain-containing protein [Chloroflexota bacterium]|nr:DUF5678 domain-containing protein [Chloroflexota bacterium]